MYRSTLIAAALASVSTAALASETISYSYDARGRLTKVVHSGSVNDGLTTSYELDKADNRLSVAVTGTQAPPYTPPPNPPGPSPPPPPPSPPPAGAQQRLIIVPLNGLTPIIIP